MQWNSVSMREELIRKFKADDEELAAYDRIHGWAVEQEACEFQSSKKPSFVIRVPTRRVPSQILTVQGNDLRFYSNHFIGNWKQYKVVDSEELESIALVGEFWNRLASEFGWSKMRDAAKQYGRFQADCKVMEPEAAWEKYQGEKEPLIALRVLRSDGDTRRFTTLLGEMFKRRVEVSLE